MCFVIAPRLTHTHSLSPLPSFRNPFHRVMARLTSASSTLFASNGGWAACGLAPAHARRALDVLKVRSICFVYLICLFLLLTYLCVARRREGHTRGARVGGEGGRRASGGADRRRLARCGDARSDRRRRSSDRRGGDGARGALPCAKFARCGFVQARLPRRYCDAEQRPPPCNEPRGDGAEPTGLRSRRRGERCARGFDARSLRRAMYRCALCTVGVGRADARCARHRVRVRRCGGGGPADGHAGGHAGGRSGTRQA